MAWFAAPPAGQISNAPLAIHATKTVIPNLWGVLLWRPLVHDSSNLANGLFVALAWGPAFSARPSEPCLLLWLQTQTLVGDCLLMEATPSKAPQTRRKR
eukprot:894838-Lingulodinium_polyedra.AAC.1